MEEGFEKKDELEKNEDPEKSEETTDETHQGTITT